MVLSIPSLLKFCCNSFADLQNRDALHWTCRTLPREASPEVWAMAPLKCAPGREPGLPHLMAAVKTRTPAEFAAAIEAGGISRRETASRRVKNISRPSPGVANPVPDPFIGQLHSTRPKGHAHLDPRFGGFARPRRTPRPHREEENPTPRSSRSKHRERHKREGSLQRGLGPRPAVFATRTWSSPGSWRVPPSARTPEVQGPTSAMNQLFRYIRSEHPRPEAFCNLSMG